jgi:hypothetical protein
LASLLISGQHTIPVLLTLPKILLCLFLHTVFVLDMDYVHTCFRSQVTRFMVGAVRRYAVGFISNPPLAIRSFIPTTTTQPPFLEPATSKARFPSATMLFQPQRRRVACAKMGPGFSNGGEDGMTSAEGKVRVVVVLRRCGRTAACVIRALLQYTGLSECLRVEEATEDRRTWYSIVGSGQPAK